MHSSRARAAPFDADRAGHRHALRRGALFYPQLRDAASHPWARDLNHRAIRPNECDVTDLTSADEVDRLIDLEPLIIGARCNQYRLV